MSKSSGTDYAKISEQLCKSLRLGQTPVAVTLTDEVPADIPAFNGAAAAGCQFWEKAVEGPIATSTPDHEMCAIGVHTHQMAGASDSCQQELGELLAVLGELDYVREEDVARIPVMSRSTKHVVYAPLAQATLPPDAVLLFANDSTGLVIAEAVEQVEEGVPPALGRPACAALPQAINTGRAALSLGCCGARAYLDVMKDDVAMWVIPGKKIATYAERFEALAKANEILGKFHSMRREDIESGARPSLQESLARLG
jgi:uncharacterized protein (DUF169 family)